jgi:hypothetical protein
MVYTLSVSLTVAERPGGNPEMDVMVIDPNVTSKPVPASVKFWGMKNVTSRSNGSFTGASGSVLGHSAGAAGLAVHVGSTTHPGHWANEYIWLKPTRTSSSRFFMPQF